MASWFRQYAQVEASGQMVKAKVLNQTWYEMAVPHPEDGHKAIVRVNDLGIAGAGSPWERWDEKPFGRGFEFLSYMGEQLDIHQAVVLTFIRQIVPYLRRYSDNDQNPLGYDWVRKDGEKITDDDEKELRRLDEILENSGTESDPKKRDRMQRRDLTGFVSALLHDSLTLDACPIELERDYAGRLVGWYALDANTVRLARESGYQGDDSIVAVQILQNQPVMGFMADELVYPIRNPRTTLAYNGYGMSELEVFCRLATSYLNTCTFNAAALDRNSLPRGFLTLYGRFNRKALNFFIQQWDALLRGAAKRFGMPVLVSESRAEGGAAWTPIDTKEAEIHYPQWLTFVNSIYTALQGTSPEILNLASFNARSGGIGTGNDTEERLQEGRNKGFIPRAMWVLKLFNTRIVPELTKKFALTWVGLFPENEDQRHEREKLDMSLDELRAKDGLDPHENPLMGKAPINPSLLPLYMQDAAMKMQAAQSGQEGGGAGDALPDGERPLPYRNEDEEDQQQPGQGGAGGGKVLPFRGAGGAQQQPQPFAQGAIAKARIGSLAKHRIEISDVRGRVRIEEEEAI
jgi:hypothetical protein